MSESFAKGVVWDLSDLYASPDDPRIEADLKEAETQAAAFEKKYKPLCEAVPQNGALPLVELMRELKAIIILATKPVVYSHLAFAQKTSDPALGAFLQKIQVRTTDIRARLIFFEVKWNQWDEETVRRLMDAPGAGPDRHFLETLRLFAPYTLKEGEEKIMAVKSNTSGAAFARLFDEVMNSIPFYIEEDGKRVKRTESEVLNYLHSPEREWRRKASVSLAEGLSANTHLLTYVFNMILADHRASLKIRNYAHPMDPMNLSNEIDRASVMRLVESVKAAYPLAQRYYRLKRKLLKLDKLYDYDRYAPVSGREEKVPYAECKRIVLEGYQAFAPEAGAVVEKFFESGWIDAEVREGKQGGGFCAATTPDLHPYILVNYTGNLRDVMTVAHELGHGLHQWLARRAGILEQNAPLTMAETASVFGEMLIFEKLLAAEKDSRGRLALLCGKIDDNFSTVFRQIAMTDFELKAHETGLAEGELAADKISDLWIQANARLYGDSVELTEHYRHGWKYIPHFIHSPFYVYAYAFAQLFVLSLFQKYKENKANFIPKYFEMLRLGGSRKPEELARLAGLDLRDPNFWKGGTALLEDLVRQAEELS